MENSQPAQPIQNQVPVQAPSPVPQNKVIEMLSKFKFDKKKLIIIGAVFGIFLVLLILISVISKSVKNIVSVKSTPSPTTSDVNIEPTPQSTVSGELSPYQTQLGDLKNQINSLDVYQSRIKPPEVNFKIDFQPKNN